MSAHDVSDGGIFTSIFESAKQRNLGFQITTNKDIRKDAFLFGENQSRFIVSVCESAKEAFEKAMGNVAFQLIGIVNAGQIIVDNENWGDMPEWISLYDTAIEKEL